MGSCMTSTKLIIFLTSFFVFQLSVLSASEINTQCVPFADSPQPDLDEAEQEAQELAFQLYQAKLNACRNENGSFKDETILFPPGPRTDETEEVNCVDMAEEAYKTAVRNNCDISRSGLISCLTTGWDQRDVFDMYDRLEEVDKAVPSGENVDPFTGKLGMKLDEHFACPGKSEPASAIYKAISCNIVSSVASMVPFGSIVADKLVNSMVPAAQRPAANECVDTQNSCLTQVMWGAIQNVFTNIQGLYDLGKLALQGIADGARYVGSKIRDGWNWLVGNDRANDAAADQAAIAARLENDIENNEEAQKATGNWAKRLVDGLLEAAGEGMRDQFSCSKWEGGVSGAGAIGGLYNRLNSQVGASARCLEAAPSWECASAKQKVQMVCGIAGFIGGEVVTTLLTGGAVRGLSLAGRAISNSASRGSQIARATVAVGRGASGFARGVLAKTGKGISVVATSAANMTRMSGGLALKFGDRIMPMGAQLQLRYMQQQLKRTGPILSASASVASKAGSVVTWPVRKYFNALERAYMLGRYGNDGAFALRNLSKATSADEVAEALETGMQSRNLNRRELLPDEDSFRASGAGAQALRELTAVQESLQSAQQQFLDAVQAARKGSNGPNAQALLDEADAAYQAYLRAKNQLGPLDEAYTAALAQHQTRIAQEASVAQIAEVAPSFRLTSTTPRSSVANRATSSRVVQYTDNSGTVRVRNISDEAVSNASLTDQARASALRNQYPTLSEQQISGVIRNHNGVDELGNAVRVTDNATGRSYSLSCPVGTCNTTQLRGKFENLTNPNGLNIPSDIAADIIRRGYAGQPNPTFAVASDGVFSLRPRNFDQFTLSRRRKVELHPDHPNAASTQALQNIEDVTGATQVRLRVTRTNPDGTTKSEELFGYFRGSDKNGEVLYFENGSGYTAINPNDPNLVINSIELPVSRVVNGEMRADGFRAVYETDPQRVLANNRGNTVEVRFRDEDGDVLSTSGEVVMHEGRLQLRSQNQYNGSQYIYSRLDDVEIEAISRSYPNASWSGVRGRPSEVEETFQVGMRVDVNYQKTGTGFRASTQETNISGEYLGVIYENNQYAAAVRLSDGSVEYVPLTSQAQPTITARAVNEEIASFARRNPASDIVSATGRARPRRVQALDGDDQLTIYQRNKELYDERSALNANQRGDLAEDLLERPLNAQQRACVNRAHNDVAGNFATYTNQQNTAKGLILARCGFSMSDIRVLMREGVTGRAAGEGVLSSIMGSIRSAFGGGRASSRVKFDANDPRNIKAGDWQARTGREDGMYSTHSGSIDELVMNDARFRGRQGTPPYESVDRRFWWIDGEIKNSKSPIVGEVGGQENLRRVVYWPTGFNPRAAGMDRYFLDNDAHRLVVNQTKNSNGEWIDHSIEAIARDADGNYVPLYYTKQNDRWVYTEQFRGASVHDNKRGCIACHHHPSAPETFTPLPYNLLGRNRAGVKGSATSDHLSPKFDENVAANIRAIYGDGAAPTPKRYAKEPTSALTMDEYRAGANAMKEIGMNEGLGFRIPAATSPEMVQNAANLPMAARQYVVQRRASIKVTSEDMADIARAHNVTSAAERESIIREMLARHGMQSGESSSNYVDKIVDELMQSGIIGPPARASTAN